MGIALSMITFIILSYSGTIYAETQLRCGGERVRIGQTMEQVKNSFGEPIQIEEKEPQDQEEPEDQNDTSISISKLIYKCGPRTFALIFMNEKLRSIRHITENKAE